MKYFMIAACILCFSLAQAETIEDQVHSIVPASGNDPHIVRFMSGRVAFVEKGDEKKFPSLQAAVGMQVKAALGARNNLHSLNQLKNLAAPSNKNLLLEEERPVYTPSVVSVEEVQNIYNRMNKNFKRRSECSDRAHVWAYDEFKRTGIMGQKAFLFFVNSYIIRHRFKWWFHVAPAYDTTSGEKYVLDYEYMDRAVPVSEWKNAMVFSKRDCVMDFRFTDYNAAADQTQDCYMKFEPMYYRLPAEIGDQEMKSIFRSSFNEADVSGARSRAFNAGGF